MNRKLIALLSALCCCMAASAQFRTEAFQQQYNDDNSSPADSADVMFSFKEYFGGLRHENEMKIGTMFSGSLIFVGGEQIYNRQYWKLPLVYTGIFGTLGTGIYLNTRGNHEAAKYCFIGSGIAYWAAKMDGVISYRSDTEPLPGRATLYSLLLPGLGQAYNGEYWKIPIYIGGLGAAYYFYDTNNTNYQRYRRIYKEASAPDYTGPITAEQAVYYRNVFRRYRDYSVLSIALVYLLQVIDANVFSYMHDFEISDDMALRIQPSLITSLDTQFAFNPAPVFGLSMGLRF